MNGRRTGAICQWPGGYAMTLGPARFGSGVDRCCDGHPTPQAAKEHGLGRLVEMASAVAAADVAWWESPAADAPETSESTTEERGDG